MDDNEAMPLDPAERRKVQNRNAQRKYRNRRNANRVGQALQAPPQPQAQAQSHAQPQSQIQGPPDQMIPNSQPIFHGQSCSGSWHWHQVPQSSGFVPQSLSPTACEPLQTSNTRFIPSTDMPPTGHFDLSTSHGSNLFDMNYTASEAELNTLSYLSDMTMPLISTDLGPDFSSHGPLSSAPGHAHSISPATSTPTNSRSLSTVPSPPSIYQSNKPASPATPESAHSSTAGKARQNSLQQIPDEQISAYMRQGSAMARGRHDSTSRSHLSSSTRGSPTASSTSNTNTNTAGTQASALAPTDTLIHDEGESSIINANLADNNPSSAKATTTTTSSSSQDYLPILHIASFRGHASIVSLLLSQSHPHPSSPSPHPTQPIDIDERDASGRTALHLATVNNHAQVAALLLGHGCAVDAGDALGRTALHWAALQRHAEMLELLIDAGAEINCCDAKEWTPLHAAVERGWEVGVQRLIREGADLSLRARKCELWKAEEGFRE